MVLPALPTLGYLSPGSELAAGFTAYVEARLPRKDSPHTLAAQRRDFTVISRHLAAQLGCCPGDLRLADLHVRPLRSAFAAFSVDHARSSIARAWSTWNGFCTFLVGEDVLPGNPMAGIERPRAERQEPKPLRGQDTPEVLLRAVAAGMRRARDPWPERDFAVLATLLVSGIRSSELLALRVGDLVGAPGDQRLHVLGKGNAERSVPVEPALTAVLDSYLDTRAARFGDGRRPGPSQWLFVDGSGRAMTRNQLQYLVRSCYRWAGVHDRVLRGSLVHALRHTFATRVVASGASAVEVMRLLGHQSLNTSQKYIDAGAQELRSAAAGNTSYEVLRQVGDC
ncbi:site-specific recombinase XerD [Kineococcus xinjiangensis]|uniref:Site-specific recombinase XerD n=1 Tax=Kineococcus xinjiangensis TaxID=512762 RepID=A0A2S6ICF4_9ACTN|nr:tyrosine-type recombinase/integrase [Kineococcus xinjiangensis]PPK90908.1 site-specific recombinase XerD [Kineococcus xinjiangensis]